MLGEGALGSKLRATCISIRRERRSAKMTDLLGVIRARFLRFDSYDVLLAVVSVRWQNHTGFIQSS